jgi:hypothetical protein
MVHWAENINNKIAASFVGRHFKLDGSGVKGERKGSRFFTEIRAGVTTFSAMVYIIRFVHRPGCHLETPFTTHPFLQCQCHHY